MSELTPSVPVVEALEVTKRFGSTAALNDVSIRVMPGESHALVGRNGAGKSTLVSILTGLRKPDTGEVRFGGVAAPSIADRDAWRERLERMEPWAATWLSHQRRDDYWRQGSACERYADIRCPVFAVGGWSDGYRDMVMRMVEHVDAPVRGLIGPWGHTGPEAGAPGPAIGFLQECVRFFDHALKGADNGFFDEPALVSYMQERIGPVTGCAAL